MQTVTPAFQSSWSNVAKQIKVYSIEMTRRYWNGAAYVLEASPIVLEPEEILKITAIQWKLDTAAQNKVLASNVTIRLKNKLYKFVETNITEGIFKPDAIATVGYEPYRTQFRIKFGYRLSDGSEEDLTLFTGEAIDYRFDTGKNEAEIRITGREIKLRSSDAQRVSTTFTNEPTVPAAGDTIETTFKTKTSVWDIQTVRVNGIVQSQGADYTLTKISDADEEAEIEFLVAPGAFAVDWSGRQWLQNKKVSELVEAICDEAGILPGDRDIEEPTYPDVTQFVQVNTADDWAAAVKVDTTTDFDSEQLALGRQIGNGGFESGDLTDWTKVEVGGTTITVVGAPVDDGSFAAALGIQIPIGNPPGFSFKAVLTLGNNPVGTANEVEVFLPDSGAFIDGQIEFPESLKGQKLKLAFVVESQSLPVTQHGYIIHDEVFTQPQIITFRHFGGPTIGVGGPQASFGLDKVEGVTVNPLASGTFVSEVKDLLAAPSQWGLLVASQILEGGAVAYETSVADAPGGPFDAFVAIDVDTTILSALKRYLKIRGTLTPNGAGTLGPTIDKVEAFFQSSSLFVGHADFKARDGLKAIQRLAEITDMEFGFDGSGKFFFRSKNVALSPVFNFNQSNVIVRIMSMRPGYDRVLNVGQISYGDYYSEFGSDEASPPETAPTSIDRFGRRIGSKSVNDFLFANNADFSIALAKIIYTANFRPKRRIRATCRIVPHLELSDVIESSFIDSPLIAETVFGDQLGPLYPSFGPSQNVIYRDTNFKVLGIGFDVIRGTCELDLLEVLS